MTTVSTSIDNIKGGVNITWQKPLDGYQTITNYLMEIKSQIGEWKQDSINCQGNDATKLSCLIPMSVFLGSNYNLNFDDLI